MDVCIYVSMHICPHDKFYNDTGLIINTYLHISPACKKTLFVSANDKNERHELIEK